MPCVASCMWVAAARSWHSMTPVPPTASKVLHRRRSPSRRPHVPANTTMDMGATCGVPRAQGVEERLHPVSLFSVTATTLTQHYDLVRHCISAKRDVVTPHHVSTIMPAEVWPDVSHAHRLNVFDALVEAGHWKLLKRRGKPYVPVIAVKFCLSSILPPVPSDVLDIPLQEVVRVSAFKDSEETLRNTMNNTAFSRRLERLAAPPRRSSLPGAESLYVREVREMRERKAKKVRAHMAARSKLKGMVSTSSGTMADAVL